MKVGFIGLSTMGQPMALNLTRAGHSLTVWNRLPHKCVPLSDAGATIVEDVADMIAVIRAIEARSNTLAATDRQGPS